MSNTLKIFGQEFSDVAGIKAMNASDVEETYVLGGDTSWVTGVFYGDLVYNETQLGSAFSNATGDFTLTMPVMTILRDGYPFENATGMKAFIAPECVSTIPQYSFRGSFVETVFCPKAKLGTRVFSSATKVTTVVANGFPNSTYLQFDNCPLIKTVDLIDNTYRADNSWQTGCPLFDTLILRDSTLLSLYNSTVFDGSCFKSGGTGGTIYIPKSLYDHLGDGTALDYRNATNWSVIDGYGTITWAQIEGSYYETHYADGTEIPQGGTT